MELTAARDVWPVGTERAVGPSASSALMRSAMCLTAAHPQQLQPSTWELRDLFLSNFIKMTLTYRKTKKEVK